MSLTLVREPPRRIGLRAKDHHLASLHRKGNAESNAAISEGFKASSTNTNIAQRGKSKHVTLRATSEEINAPPESASDASSVRQEDEADSDDSMPEARGIKQRFSLDSAAIMMSSQPKPVMSEDHRLLYSPQSSIPGSQGSHKRGTVEVEDMDDATYIWGSQSKRPKRTYGGSSQASGVVNIHVSPSLDGSKKSRKYASPRSKGGGRDFRAINTSYKNLSGRMPTCKAVK